MRVGEPQSEIQRRGQIGRNTKFVQLTAIAVPKTPFKTRIYNSIKGIWANEDSSHFFKKKIGRSDFIGGGSSPPHIGPNSPCRWRKPEPFGPGTGRKRERRSGGRRLFFCPPPQVTAPSSAAPSRGGARCGCSMADTTSQVLLGSGLTVLSQPLMYVKVLVQMGYEPLPPTLGRNIFGRQVYQLPGLFAYAKHIMKIDGRAGLFKGLAPRLCSGAIGTVVHSKVLQQCQNADQSEELGNTCKESGSSLDQVIKETSQEMIARSAATLVTHPFHVITLRCMVQFIGRETKYSGVFSSFVTIYQEEGIFGFFAGLIPRLLGDILSLWLCNILAYLINTYALENGVSTMTEMKGYSQAVTGFFTSMLTYPFVLVSNLMAINSCGLAAGLPPYAPAYTSWLHCWSQLHREGNMSRGNSLFFRKVPAGKRYVWEEKRFQ